MTCLCQKVDKMRPADSGVKIDTVRSWICLLDPREKWLNDCDKNHMWTSCLQKTGPS